MAEIWIVPILAAAMLAVLWPLVAGREKAPQGSGRGPRDREETAIWVERRERVLSALAELESDREAGNLSVEDYRSLRTRYEMEAARVLRRLKALPAPHSSAAQAGAEPEEPDPESRSEPQPEVARTTRPASAGRFWALGLFLFLVVTGLALVQGLGPRAPGGTITGNDGVGQSRGSESGEAALVPVDWARLTELEARIREDSTDVEALDELAHLYVGMQRFGEASDLSMRALREDPRDAHAMTHLGVVVWGSGDTDMALWAFDHALRFQPDYHEALLFKGIVLFTEKRDFSGATDAWERYLEVAPPDADTERVRALLEEARRAAFRGSGGGER